MTTNIIITKTKTITKIITKIIITTITKVINYNENCCYHQKLKATTQQYNYNQNFNNYYKYNLN